MSDLITLQIVGTESEGGHLLVPDFIGRLENFLSALNGVDRVVGQSPQPTLDYRIVDAKHSSPLSITIEPVLKKRITNPEPRHIQIRRSRFFQELTAIKRNEPVSRDIDDFTLEHLRKLVEGVGKEFVSARISNGETQVELDAAFDRNIRRLLDEEDASYGSEEGMLEAVNLRSRTCRIYPRIGAPWIRCDFLPGTRDQIRENLGKYVRVEGMKYFRSGSPFPFRVDVKEFGALDEDSSIPIKDLGGIAPDATGELSSVDFVRRLRDEWD